MTTQGTFILGVGAQKSGTSWLHRYFASHDDFETGILKEYHVLDAIFVQGMEGRYNGTMKAAAEALLYASRDNGSRKKVRRALMTIEPQSYFDYFQNLLRKKGKRFTADITPAYSALPMRALRKVQREFDRREIAVKPVFLMRDPVERAWSALRMARRDGKLRSQDFRKVGINDPYALTDDELLQMLPEMPGYQARANYRKVIQKLDTVFPAEDITYAFYEELFTEDCVRRISDTIGFTYKTPDFGEIANASPKKTSLDDKTLDYLTQRYGAMYAYVGERFGADRVAQLWPNYQRL